MGGEHFEYKTPTASQTERCKRMHCNFHETKAFNIHISPLCSLIEPMPDQHRRSNRRAKPHADQPRDSESQSPARDGSRPRESASSGRGGYAENLVRQEAAQSFERATAAELSQSRSDESGDSQTSSPSPSLGKAIPGLHLYHSLGPSSATPMERFATISTANEPFRLLASTNMQDMKLDIGSLDSLPTRISAASQVAGEVGNIREHRGGVASSHSVILRPGGDIVERQWQGDSQQRTRGGKRSVGSGGGGRSPKRHQPLK
ncbi:hypothetical protein K431DRAFT_4379 [Polychaeton citri CBS 116435]|uniref:Uncharacterized protein n=1 Tax=Polychaeton citri CBS 116435 TaxID=1314669 RepID=A0A9P4QJT5_9PEZI|nr:hypothetical protein K431DRAFT_4379 [Polychaeton citri CBS 116435]